MSGIYEAPTLTMYGNVAALTRSAKCTPGGDSVYAGSLSGVNVAVSGGQTIQEGAPVFYIVDNAFGAQVPTGTDCVHFPGMVPFQAN